MMCLNIILHDGNVMLIDCDDAHFLEKYHLINYGGYCVARKMTNAKREKAFLHRLVMNAPKGYLVDHINRNILDNRKVNLRLATPAGNSRNRKPRGNAVYKGIRKTFNKWSATILVDGKSKFLGNFHTPELAAQAYNDAAILYYGEFAWLNKIPKHEEI